MIRIPENLSTKLSNMVNSYYLALPLLLFRRIQTPILTAFTERLHRPNNDRHSSCWLCRESFSTNASKHFCPPCSADLPLLRTVCFRCSLPLSISPSENNADADQYSRLCGECISQSPGFFCTVASFRYEFPIKELIRRIKYRKQRYWLKPLTKQLIADIRSAPAYLTKPLPELLIPVPIHKKGQKERSFNQALLIANEISRNLNIPVNAGILLKTGVTENQASLKKADRLRNLKHAFSISRKTYQKNLIRGKHIALIDDVMTTKATAQLATKKLLDAGAIRVDIWCLARTPKS